MSESPVVDRLYAGNRPDQRVHSLADRLAQFDSPAQMLQSNPAFKFSFGYPTQYTSWDTEQDAWKNSALLFDQSIHMDAVTVTGPDVKRLFSDVGVNSFASFGRNKAKQLVTVTPEGKFIGDTILFGLDDDEYSMVGVALVNNWVQYQLEKGDYDVDIAFDPRTSTTPGAPRRFWRYQLNGPATHQIVERAAGGGLPEIRFFGVGEFTITGTPVHALNHTMSGVPGREYTGLELWGPYEHRDVVLDALTAAGADLGLVRGGERTYLSATWESAWIPVPVPAIYTSPELEDYRRWLPAGIEAFLSLEGSFFSPDIEDYYSDPWDLGYGRLVRFDHDFIGRDALEARAQEPHRRKVWLEWDVDETAELIEDALFGEGERPRMVDLPNTAFASSHYDTVLAGGRRVGLSTWGGYTTNSRRLVSIGMVDDGIRDAAEVEVVWGQDPKAPAKPLILPHVQRTIRATVHDEPLV